MPPHPARAALPGPGAVALHRGGGGLSRAVLPARRAAQSVSLPPPTPTRSVRTHAAPKPRKGAPKKEAPANVSYGASWYEATRNPTGGRTAAQEIARRKAANWEANGRKRDREDLYTAASGGAWEGSEYVGSANNVLTWIIVASVAAPLAGLAFAYWSYGTLWG